jgi:iron complex transport system permease protein
VVARRSRPLLLLLLAGGLLLVLLSPLLSSVPIPLGTEFWVLSHQASGGLLFGSACPPGTSSLLCTAYVEILWYAIVPQVILALLVGAALGLSGAALQGTFRNPLADPYLLGISSGGTLGAAFLFVFQVGLDEANLVLPLLAFLGSLGTGALILLASRYLGGSSETLLLVGVALANVLSAVLSVVLLFNPLGSVQVSFWLLGGLGGASWNRDGLVLGGLLIAGAPLLLLGRELNILQLGPDVAQSLGVNATQVRHRLLLLASIATSVAVAFAGIIGFVGLIAPHVVRRVWSSDYRAVLPGSALVGAAFLLLAHDFAVLIVPSVVLPVGLFTAFAGAPFFFGLLFWYRRGVFMGEAR